MTDRVAVESASMRVSTPSLGGSESLDRLTQPFRDDHREWDKVLLLIDLERKRTN